MREGGLLRYELFVFFRHFLGSEPGHVNVKGRVKNGHEGRKVQDERPRCVIHIRDAEHTHGEEGIGGPGHKGARRAFPRLQRRGSSFRGGSRVCGTGEP